MKELVKQLNLRLNWEMDGVYAFENDELFDDETMIEWFADYENRNKMYLPNQKENYLHMKADLDKFIMKGVA